MDEACDIPWNHLELIRPRSLTVAHRLGNTVPRTGLVAICLLNHALSLPGTPSVIPNIAQQTPGPLNIKDFPSQVGQTWPALRAQNRGIIPGGPATRPALSNTILQETNAVPRETNTGVRHDGL